MIPPRAAARIGSAAILLLSGCSTPAGRHTKTGAGTGALIGVGAGAMVGNPLIGLVAGGAIGAATGHEKDRKVPPNPQQWGNPGSYDHQPGEQWASDGFNAPTPYDATAYRDPYPRNHPAQAHPQHEPRHAYNQPAYPQQAHPGQGSSWDDDPWQSTGYTAPNPYYVSPESFQR